MVINVRNVSKSNKQLRPFKDRNQSLNIAPDQIVSIELNQCSHDVTRFPKYWFERYGCYIVKDKTTSVTKPDEIEPKVAPVVQVKAPCPCQQKKEEPITKSEEVIKPVVQPVQSIKSVDSNELKLNALNGDWKQYNQQTKSWQRVKTISSCASGRVLSDNKNKKDYLIKSKTNTELTLKLITKEEADKLIGVSK